jgi:hypothetical protein
VTIIEETLEFLSKKPNPSNKAIHRKKQKVERAGVGNLILEIGATTGAATEAIFALEKLG